MTGAWVAVSDVAEEHGQAVGLDGKRLGYCGGCEQDWPCDVAIVLAELTAADARNEAAWAVIEALAARHLTHCTQNGCYCQVCGGSWYPNAAPDHHAACPYARGVVLLAERARAGGGEL